ncbi:MAG: hypothetical protein RL557_134 [archaeon]|jgi:hypothetical protein
MNTKGWIIIVEAFIAVLIVSTALLFILKEDVPQGISAEMHEQQRAILEIISNDDTMRTEALNRQQTTIGPFIRSTLPDSFDYVLTLCDSNQICNQGIPTDRDVFVSETILSADHDSFPGKKLTKLRLFVWRK